MYDFSEEEIERYSRHILLADVGIEGQEKIHAAKVLIVGAGGLGAPVSLYLAAAGVGTIGIVDFDVVDVSNLQRQICHFTEDVGRPKVESAAAKIKAINPHVNVITYNDLFRADNALDIVKDYDFVVDGTDNFSARFAVSDACCRLGIPYVYGAVNALEGQVSVLCCGHATYRTLYPDEQATLAMPHPGKAVVGVTPALVGSVQASQVLQLVCGYGTPLVDKLWTVDLRTLQTFVIDL